VVILKQPEAPLELIRSKAMELDTRKYGHVLLGRLDTLLNPKVLAELDEHGTTFLDWRTPRRLDMMTSQRRPVVKEMSPPGLVYLRSEEHTSELQSRENLVCRLLLEKKKKKKNSTPVPHSNRTRLPGTPNRTLIG